MNALQMQGIKKAAQTRTKLKLDKFQPINIIDACADLGISVRFVNVSMEGMYINQGDTADPVILLSSLRPFGRRIYTCGHELGHHIFGHGTKIDELIDENTAAPVYDRDEYLVDIFSGALLMPIAGIEAAFAKRNWDPKNSSPVNFYTISSIFGTGYSTLVRHCTFNHLISESKASALLKFRPANILQQLIGEAQENSHFKIIDKGAEISSIDLEIGNYLFLPEDLSIEGKHLRKLGMTIAGNVFVAEWPGITRALSAEEGHFIRVQNANYNGLAEYRYLEDNITIV